MTKGVARPVQPKTEVRRYVTDAINRFGVDFGRVLMREERATYEYPTCTVELNGENNFSNPCAVYVGELGKWVVTLGRGSSRYKTICPVLVKSPAELSTH